MTWPGVQNFGNVTKSNVYKHRHAYKHTLESDIGIVWIRLRLLLSSNSSRVTHHTQTLPGIVPLTLKFRGPTLSSWHRLLLAFSQKTSPLAHVPHHRGTTASPQLTSSFQPPRPRFSGNWPRGAVFPMCPSRRPQTRGISKELPAPRLGLRQSIQASQWLWKVES